MNPPKNLRRAPSLLILGLCLACQSNPTRSSPQMPSTTPAAEAALAPPASSPPAPTPVSVPTSLGFRLTPEGRPLPPIAKRIPTSRVVHGHTLTDDYGWLKERDNPEVRAFLEEENRYTDAMTAALGPRREALYKELVGRLREDDLSVPYRKGEYFYYNRREAGKQYAILCRRRGHLEAAEEVMLDGNELAAGNTYWRLGSWATSPDGRLLAYATDTDGSERHVLRIRDLATGELLADEIHNTGYGLAWASDNRTLFYLTADDASRPYRLFRHTLGAKAGNDTLVFEEPDAAFYLALRTTLDERFMLLESGSLTSTEIRFMPTDQPTGKLGMVAERRTGVRVQAHHHGGFFYLLTNDGAKNFRLVRTAVGSADPAGWEEVIPGHPETTLQFFEVFARHLVVWERSLGLPRVRVRQLVGPASGGRPTSDHWIDFPEPVYSVGPSDNAEFDTAVLRLRYSSLVTPTSIFDYDMDRRERELKKQDEIPGGYDPSAYTSERIFATASDGERIPISLLYRRDLHRDGAAPCWLSGYGAYGSSNEAFFSANRLPLLDRGVIVATAHVRGGGDLGERWHDGGKLANKRNTFGDFIAVAEHLITQRYTASSKAVASGGSAGGLLVGAVINERPELFRVALAAVPFVDVLNTMLDPSLPLTVTEYEEWGNPNRPEEFAWMLAYSPYDQVAPRPYPSLLVTTGWNDSRVSYWEPAKWVSKLRAVGGSPHPILLKTKFEAGHGGASGRYDALRELAFQYAFVLDQLGVPEPDRP